jgi:hypothetical protein
MNSKINRMCHRTTKEYEKVVEKIYDFNYKKLNKNA